MGENGSDGFGVLVLIGLPAKTGDLRFMVVDMADELKYVWFFEIIKYFRDVRDLEMYCFEEVGDGMVVYLFPLVSSLFLFYNK